MRGRDTPARDSGLIKMAGGWMTRRSHIPRSSTPGTSSRSQTSVCTSGWGSPQWQIEARRRVEMPELLMKQFGYAPLTTGVKAKIFGLNAARLYGIDPSAKRNPIPGDYVERLRKQYKEVGPAPSNTQYGW